ncbi:DUF2799 domain-containing protein [Succinimonas sp.]|uniref:DUF2799 domain-containing protein n=1 Tax=Succinimonas sp. TaxID=1936151 RepID=UPI003863E6BF
MKSQKKDSSRVILNLSRIISLTTVVILTGICCACLNAGISQENPGLNWYQIGYMDGHEGQSSAMFKEYESVLLSALSPEEKQNYMKGWKKGLEKYCAPGSRRASGKDRARCEELL